MKKLIVFTVAVIMLMFSSTKSNAQEISTQDIFSKYYEQSGADSLEQYLPEYVDEYIHMIDIENPVESVKENFSVKNVFEILLDFFKNNIKSPLKFGLAAGSLILFSAAIGGLHDNKLLIYVTNIGVAFVSVLPALSVAVACAEAIISSGTFMLSFIPVIAVLIAVCGKPLTSAGFSGVMTIAVQAVTTLCSYFVVPLSCLQLALGVSSSFSFETRPPAIASTIKKISVWSLSLICTVFLCVLGIQTAINSPSDNLYSKTAKFVLGSTVPIVGNVVSEAFNTVRGSLHLLHSSVAVYGVVAVAVILLPILIQLIIWRVVLNITGMMADMFMIKETSCILKAVDGCFAFLLGISVLMFAMFIISIAIVTVV